VERLLVNDLKSILQSCECPLDSDSKSRVSKIEEFLGISGIEPCRELIDVAPSDLKGGTKLGWQA
jgi:hypothetical protein